MAKRGPKSRPPELKLAAGTRADRINPDAPAAIPGVPTAPEHLDVAAREEWDRQVALLARMGVLSQTDYAALAVYCSVFSRWRKAKAHIRVHGLTIPTAQAGEKTNPAVGIAERCEVQMRAWLTEFGCTPASRGNVDSTKGEKRDALGDFLARRTNS